MEFVIPGRREAASPESSNHRRRFTGFRALGLTASPRNDGVYDSNFGNTGLVNHSLSVARTYRSSKPGSAKAPYQSTAARTRTLARPAGSSPMRLHQSREQLEGIPRHGL